MLYHRDLYAGVGLADYLRVVWHGLPMDASVAGYFTALPALLLTLSVWERARLWADRVRRGWTVVMAVLLSIIYIVDLVLYGFWKFRLDTTPIFYFTSSPKDAFASVSVGYVVVALLVCCAFGVGLWWLLHRYLDERLRPVSCYIIIVYGGPLFADSRQRHYVDNEFGSCLFQSEPTTQPRGH